MLMTEHYMQEDMVAMDEMDGPEEFEEEDMEEFGLGEVEDEMEPDDTFEPVGEQGPNTREAFEDGDEDDLLWEEE